MRLLGMLLLLSFFATSAYGQEAQQQYRPLQGLKVTRGQAMPDFSAVPSLKSFRGKPLLINFYTVHCAPCIKEIPKLNALKHLNPELQVLAITPDSSQEAAEYAKERRLSWPIATAGEDYVFNTLGLPAFPAFAILDEQGNLLSATYANQLGGEDGHATLPGISGWVEIVLGTKLK
jgi:thiol-disulfide isomerase/thioredoxin